MAVVDGRGYLLPDGDAFTDEQQCCFVYLPAGDEYRRAFFGALDYFGTWLAWERDAGKRGKDAARAWKLANELTRECWEMGTCDLMVAELQAIRLLLSEQHCCDGNNSITYYDNTVVTTTIIPGEGDPPDSWGESEEPVDWDDWAQYVCYHAHVWVDNLIAYSETLDDLVGVGSWAIDFLGFIISSITYTPLLGLPVPVSFSFVNKISAALIANLEGLEFDTMASKLEAGREDIVCAFMLGTSLEDAVESAVDDSLLWTVFYSWFDYESTVATIYTGEVAGVGYLPPSQSEECECEPAGPQQLLENPGFVTTKDPWVVNTGTWPFHQIHVAEWCIYTGAIGDAPYTALKSNTFQVNGDYPVVQPSFRMYLPGDRNWTPYMRVYRSSDDAVVGTAVATFSWSTLGTGWHTLDASTSIDCTGYTDEDLYVRIRCMVFGGDTNMFIGNAWLTELE